MFQFTESGWLDANYFNNSSLNAVCVNKRQNSYLQFCVTETNKNRLKKSKPYITNTHFASHIPE